MSHTDSDMWFRVTEKSTYHYFEAPKMTLCGLQTEKNTLQIVEHKTILDKGKCKNCLRLKEKNDRLEKQMKEKRLVSISRTRCLHKVV